jgi:hypothetical protein
LETNQLIHQIAGGAEPVRRLAAPWRRAAIWLAISLPYAAAMVLLRSMHVNAADPFSDWQFLVEEGAILLTAITAVTAAFCSVVPGYSRKMLLLPLLPLAVWLATLGNGCAQEWLRLGAAGLRLRMDWDCLPPAAMIGAVPAIVIVAMLRRGAPLYPRATMALAALAVAALVNFMLRIYHVGDVSIMVLVWHFGSVVVFSLLAGWIGTLLLNWNRVRSVPANPAG